MTSRRDFLKNSAFAALAASAGGCRGLFGDGFAVNGIRIGVQMWSVNDLWKADPAGAFRRLKALGYDGVQSFGFLAMDANELEKMLDGEGLKIVDMPFYMKNMAPGKFEQFIEFCLRFKIEFAFEPWADCKTADGWRRHAQDLLRLKDRFAPYGVRVGYHNHQHELKKTFDGKCALDFLAEAGLDFELDVGHANIAGSDPLAWLARLRERVPSIHAKPGGKGLSVGGKDDSNDWPAIFAAAGAAVTRWAIVECEARRNTYEDVERSAAYLKRLDP